MIKSDVKTRDEAIAKVNELIRGIRFAMLTTVGEDGYLYSRPMATQQTEFDGTAWFFSSDDSPKAREVLHDKHVNLAYSDPSANRYVSLSGIAEVIHDEAKCRELWNPMLKAYFPDGLEDPHLSLIRVTVDRAQYWDGPSRPVHFFELARAVLTGDEYDAGENSKLDLKRSA